MESSGGENSADQRDAKAHTERAAFGAAARRAYYIIIYIYIYIMYTYKCIYTRYFVYLCIMYTYYVTVGEVPTSELIYFSRCTPLFSLDKGGKCNVNMYIIKAFFNRCASHLRVSGARSAQTAKKISTLTTSRVTYHTDTSNYQRKKIEQ